MIRVMRRSVKQFALTEIENANGTSTFSLYRRSDKAKIGKAPIPGVWRTQFGPIGAITIYAMIEAYFSLIKQPWEGA